MWSRHIGFTNTKIKDCLISSAVKLGAGQRSTTRGATAASSAEAALRCGDVVVLPSIVGAEAARRRGSSCSARAGSSRSAPTLIPVRCPSRIIVQCPSLVPETCPTQVPALCPTQVPERCPSRIIVQCPSQITVQCPSRAPILCPVSRVPAECPSRPPRAVPDDAGAGDVRRRDPDPERCAPGPSSIPATCPIPIPDLPIPDPGPLGPAGEGSEQWYGEGEWYVVDDAGEARPFPGAERPPRRPSRRSGTGSTTRAGRTTGPAVDRGARAGGDRAAARRRPPLRTGDRRARRARGRPVALARGPDRRGRRPARRTRSRPSTAPTSDVQGSPERELAAYALARGGSGARPAAGAQPPGGGRGRAS